MNLTKNTLVLLFLITSLVLGMSVILVLHHLTPPHFLVGFASFDTGVVNFTIQAAAVVLLTVDNVDFGSGTVNTGGLNTSLNTSDTAWGGGSNPNGFSNPGPFQVRNDGNVDFNISVNSSSDASTFIGGTNPGYYFVASDVGTSDDGCIENKTNNSTILMVSSTPQLICENLTYADAADQLNISVFIDIPSDASTGLKTDSGFEVHAEQL